jgi:hypothetical protein
MQLSRMLELLSPEVVVSYRSLRRFLARTGLVAHAKRTTVRMAPSPPREIAEMDFGQLGTLVHTETGARELVWALRVVLPFSRFAFVWLLVHQTLEEVIAGLDASWRFFGGMPQRLIIDNFPAAVAGPDALEPRLTRVFLEYSQARGFIADPARVRRPRDKLAHLTAPRQLDGTASPGFKELRRVRTKPAALRRAYAFIEQIWSEYFCHWPFLPRSGIFLPH